MNAVQVPDQQGLPDRTPHYSLHHTMCGGRRPTGSHTTINDRNSDCSHADMSVIESRISRDVPTPRGPVWREVPRGTLARTRSRRRSDDSQGSDALSERPCRSATHCFRPAGPKASATPAGTRISIRLLDRVVPRNPLRLSGVMDSVNEDSLVLRARDSSFRFVLRSSIRTL